ncbi:MAG: HTH-type transcriptional regulator CynR [Pseudomonas citronellolis]|nr:MAG: HTH-type transcriptional regulator CynR [Pseudomonas citronellolis]
MNFKQLSHFVALAEHRSFMRASEACNITQPAFSRSIRSLEEELGCALIDRHSGRNFQPTVQGERVLQHARTVLEGLARLTSEAHQDTDLSVGQVRIGCGPLPAADLVPLAIASFIDRYPRMQVHLDVENWQKLVRSLQREELEFLVAASEPFIDDPNYDVHLLRPQRMALYCRADHPLRARSRVTAAQLFAYPVGLAGASKENLARLARANGVNTPQIGVECDNIHTLLSVIGNSDVIGMLHAECHAKGLAAENIVRMDNLVGAFDNRFARCAVILRRGQRLSPGAERLLQIIKDNDRLAGLSGPALQLAN